MSAVSKYLSEDDPNCFLGMSKREAKAGQVECPRCHGYGGGHLELNAYGDGRHFDWSCSNCNGWGYVRAGSPDALCSHDYSDRMRNVGNCLNVWKCAKCGHEITVDSSG